MLKLNDIAHQAVLDMVKWFFNKGFKVHFKLGSWSHKRMDVLAITVTGIKQSASHWFKKEMLAAVHDGRGYTKLDLG